MARVKGSGVYTKDIHVRVSDEEFKKLTAIAEINGIYRGKLLRKIIQDFLKTIPLEINDDTEHRTQ